MLIDIAPGTAMFVNDAGQAVYEGTNGSYYFWNGGSSSAITAPSGTTLVSLIGLNNAGKVGGTLHYPPDDPGHSLGDLHDKGMAVWSGGSWTEMTPSPTVLSYGQDLGIDPTTGAHEVMETNFFESIIRSSVATALNDGGTMVGYEQETASGPYSQAQVAVEGNGWYRDAVVLDLHGPGTSLGPPSCLIGGTNASLVGINDGGTIIGTYSIYGYGTNGSPPVAGTIPEGLGGAPSAINDNGVIVGSGGAVWLPGSYRNKKLNGPDQYINNQMVAASGWYHGRNLGLPVTAPGWSGFSGVAISHNTGIITANATTNFVQHAVLFVPDQIQRDGRGISADNNTVCVGQQINLTNMIYGFPTNSVTYQWSIPGANNTTNDTAFYDYEPTAMNSNYTNLFTPTNYTTNSYVNFYWSAGGTNTVTCTTVIYGQTNTMSATFNVLRPFAEIMVTNGPTTIDEGNPSLPFLRFGDSTVPVNGITFSQTNSVPSSFTGTFSWSQLINTNSWIGISPNPSHSIDSESNGYDGTKNNWYPYHFSTSSNAVDSPAKPLISSFFTNEATSFTATMYLMWQPDSTNSLVNGDKTVAVPLRSYQWTWNATATNSGSTWGIQNSTNYHGPINIDETNEPTWSTNEFYNRTLH